MTLTRSGKQTLFLLVTGIIIIFIASLVLYHYLLFFPNFSNKLKIEGIEHVNQVAQHVKRIPEKYRHPFVSRNQYRSVHLNLTDKPKFAPIAQLVPAKVLPTLDKTKRLERSIPIEKNQWLNVTIVMPSEHWAGRIIAIIILTLTWLIALIVLCYWAVRRLNLPMRVLMQGLQHVNEHQEWVPMALIGDKEQRSVMRQINDLQSRLQRLINDRTHVLAAISHDLRTPLTRLKLRAEYLQDHSQYEKLMSDITEMEAMITETLDYFRDASFEEGAQTFDLNALLNSICDDLADLNFNVTYESSLNRLPYTGKLNLLKRAFNNLINNAIHYGSCAKVRLSVSDDIEITIDDEGEGIKPVDKEKVFSPFYRVEGSRSRETGGAGLGLTISKEVMQSHGGKIDLINLPGHGLRVKINLPS